MSDEVGWRTREEDPPGVRRWWDGSGWTTTITGGEVVAAVTVARRDVESVAFPNGAARRRLDALEQQVRTIEQSVVAEETPVPAPPPAPVPVAGFPDLPARPPARSGAGLGEVLASGASFVARLVVSLLWGFGVVLCFQVGAVLPALGGIAYLAYLWVWRGRWLIY